MKLFFLITLLAVTCSGCFNRSVHQSANKAMVGDDDVFVITKKGKKISGSKIKLYISGRNAGNVRLDDQDYLIDNLTSFQSKDGYFTNFENLWYQRIYNGTIEAFTKRETKYGAGTMASNQTTTTTFAYLSKRHGELKDYTTANLYELVNDDKSALAVFNSTYKKTTAKTPWDYQYKNLIHVLEAYK